MTEKNEAREVAVETAMEVYDCFKAKAGLSAAKAIIQTALDKARAEGAAEAEARVVAWLRDRHKGHLVSQIAIAEWLERGEHLTTLAQETE